MSDLLSIGKSGVTAYRTALSVVGDNIVNAETEGYARRSVVLRESAASSGTSLLYKSRTSFGGVEPAAISRAWDDFRAADSRLAGSTAARSDARVRWLGTLETAIADGDTGVGQSVTAVFNAGDALASEPGNGFSRRAFLLAIDEAATSFRTTASALQRTSAAITTQASSEAATAGYDIAQLAKINTQISRLSPGQPSFAQMADERDRLLDDLSNRMDISVTINTNGTAVVSLPRRADLKLVDPGSTAAIAIDVSTGSSGRIAYTIKIDGDPYSYSPAGGSLAGLAESGGIVANRRDQLDVLAKGFAKSLNDWSAAGTDANGAPGTALLTVDPAQAAASITASVVDRDPATVAAALTVVNADLTTTVTANGNMLTLAGVREAAGTEKGWADMVANQSQILASARTEDIAAAARKTASYAARDEVSGVDLDEEASELLRFQQAYNGSAKIIQVARETLQAIMDIL